MYIPAGLYIYLQLCIKLCPYIPVYVCVKGTCLIRIRHLIDQCLYYCRVFVFQIKTSSVMSVWKISSWRSLSAVFPVITYTMAIVSYLGWNWSVLSFLVVVFAVFNVYFPNLFFCCLSSARVVFTWKQKEIICLFSIIHLYISLLVSLYSKYKSGHICTY